MPSCTYYANDGRSATGASLLPERGPLRPVLRVQSLPTWHATSDYFARRQADRLHRGRPGGAWHRRGPEYRRGEAAVWPALQNNRTNAGAGARPTFPGDCQDRQRLPRGVAPPKGAEMTAELMTADLMDAELMAAELMAAISLPLSSWTLTETVAGPASFKRWEGILAARTFALVHPADPAQALYCYCEKRAAAAGGTRWVKRYGGSAQANAALLAAWVPRDGWTDDKPAPMRTWWRRSPAFSGKRRRGRSSDELVPESPCRTLAWRQVQEARVGHFPLPAAPDLRRALHGYGVGPAGKAAILL